MGVAFVQTLGSGGGTGSVAITVGANTTVGNMVSVGGRISSGHTISSVSDTRGNTWTIDSQSSSTQANAGLASCIIASGKQILAGDTITVTFSAATNCQANATEYSGVAVSAGAAVVDQAATPAHSATASVTVATTANSAAGDLVISCAGGSVNNSALSITAADPDSGGTWTDLAYTGADCAYQIGAAAASLYSAAWAETSATNMSAVLVTYQAASTGPSGPFSITLPAPATALAASVWPSGPLAITLPAPATALAASVWPAGPLAITLPAPATALAGTVTGPPAGPFAITLPALAAAISGTVPPPLIMAMAAKSGTDPYGNQILPGANFGPVSGAHFGIDQNGNLYLADSTGSTRLYLNPSETFIGFYATGGHSSGAYPLLALAAAPVTDHGNSIPGGVTLTGLPMLVYAGTPAKGNLIFSATPSQVTDPFGNTVPEGLWAKNTGGYSGGLSMSTGTADEQVNAFLATVVANSGAANQQLQLFLWSARNSNHPESSLIWMGSASDDGTMHAFGTLAWYDSAGGYHACANWDMNGVSVYAGSIVGQHPGASTPTPETWQSLPAPSAAGFSIGGLARYKRLADSNMVRLSIQNLATTSQPADGTAIWAAGTLPAAYQPAHAQRFATYQNNAGAEVPALDIRADGSIAIYGIGSTTATRIDLHCSYELD